MEIIITYGLPASGKSRWAKQQEAYKRINKDDLRAMIDNGRFSTANEKFILQLRDTLIEKALRNGENVIVDDTNFPFHGKHYERICEIAQIVGNVTVTEKYFPITLTDAITANQGPHRIAVPDSVIRIMYNKHIRDKEIPEMTSVHFGKIAEIALDASLPSCVLLDLDGTISHAHGKRGFYDWSAVGNEEVDENIAMIIRALSKDGMSIFAVSGRDAVCRPQTEAWLTKHNIPHKALFMRPQGDQRKDSIVKHEIYEQEFKGKYNIVACFDDRDQVVNMYRSLGLKVCQVAPGDF